MGQTLLAHETEKLKLQKCFEFLICFGDLGYLILPSPAKSIKPKKCRSLRELQTTKRMPTVCMPSISHSSLKNTNMVPTQHKSSPCPHPRLPTFHCLPHSQPHTLSLFVELQKHLYKHLHAISVPLSQLLSSCRDLCGGSQQKNYPTEEFSPSNGLIINQPQRQERMESKV